MYEQTELEPLVRQWEAEGKWIDCGNWRRARNGALEYEPTEAEIEAKCVLLCQIENWQGAYKRAPRGGRHAVMSTCGLQISLKGTESMISQLKPAVMRVVRFPGWQQTSAGKQRVQQAFAKNAFDLPFA